MKEQRELKGTHFLCDFILHTTISLTVVFFIGKYRTEAGLALPEEDTIEVTRTMRAASPPASAADLLEAQNQKPGPAARPFRRVRLQFFSFSPFNLRKIAIT